MPRKNRTPKHQPYVDTNPCQSKRHFASEAAATKAAELQTLQNNEDLSTYKCERCGGWHLTRKKRAT